MLQNTNRNPPSCPASRGGQHIDRLPGSNLADPDREEEQRRGQKVAASTYRTFCAPISAMPKPLMAGPNNTPMLVVLWMNAFAVVS